MSAIQVFFSLLGILAFVFVVLTPIWILLFKSWVSGNVLKKLAKRLNGHVYGGTCCGLPQVVYEQHGQRYQIRVEAGKKDKSSKVMHLTGPWPGHATRVTIFPETFWTRANKLMGMEDHQLGQALFDSTFVLQSSSYEELVDLFQPNVQGLLLHIVGANPSMNLSIYGGHICLSIETAMGNVDMLGQHVANFYNLRAELLRNVFGKMSLAQRLAVEKEMKVVGLKSMNATCMVCGTEVTDLRVECRRCQTPHHKDCWGYFGGCSRYGCGESVFVDGKAL